MAPRKIDRSTFHSVRQIALVVVATASLAAPTISHASPVGYVFSDASATLIGSNGTNTQEETITGSFTFDAATSTESLVDITLTGGAPFDLTYTQTTSALTPASDVIRALNGPDAAGMVITFSNPLNGASPDPITSVVYTNAQFDAYTSGNGTPMGSAVVAPAPVIGHGLLVFLAVGGVLFGSKLLERRREARLQSG